MDDFVVLTDDQMDALLEQQRKLTMHVNNLSFIIGQLIIRSKQLEEARYPDLEKRPSHTMPISECVERLGSTVIAARGFIAHAKRDTNGQEDTTNSTGDTKEAQ